MDNFDLRYQLVDLGLVKELRRLGSALLVVLGAVDDDAAHRVALEDAVADADDVLPALVLVTRVEAGNLLLERELLPLLRRQLVGRLRGEAPVDGGELVLPVGTKHAWQCHSAPWGRARTGPCRPCLSRRSSRRIDAELVVYGASVDDRNLHDDGQQDWQEVPARGLDPRLHGVCHDDDLPHFHGQLQHCLDVNLKLAQRPLVLLVLRRRLEEA
mmetsp:Transcript_57910/g.152496  ORF Transcript_57910/g.152496 Transcript_57910/m.152496 type:complete len:214 (+) Transcript_57910:253-894(+)